jgi:hypothetical protein
MDILYTPEKIDEFIGVAEKVIQNGKNLFFKYKDMIISINIFDVVEDIEKYKTLHSKISNDRDILEKAYNKFYDIVEMYDSIDRPDNVKKLDDLASDIDHLSLDVYYLMGALENVIEAGEDLNKQYFNK